MSASDKSDAREEHHEGEMPQMDFATFVLSLSHSALMHLGEVPHPDTNKTERDLPLAKQNIDLLGLLEDKTKGNLTGDEERLLHQVLFDLRMRYVELSKAAAQPSGAAMRRNEFVDRGLADALDVFVTADSKRSAS